MDGELGAVVQEQDDDLEEPASGVEAEAELPGWLVVVDGVGDEVLLGGGAAVWMSSSLIPCLRAER